MRTFRVSETWRRVVLWMSLLLLGLASTAAAAKPHVIFILADDLGYGDLGCYGCKDIRTPNLDRLAKEGTRFTEFYANAAICSPTRAAFLTGQYQQRIDLEDALYYQEMGRGLPLAGRTLADDLKAAGYTTALAGKWHLGYDDGRRPNQQGFDHFFGLLGGNHHYFKHMDRIGVPDLFENEEPAEREGYSTDLISDAAIRFLRELTPKKPTFLFLSYNAPHFPFQGPDDQDKPVEPKKKNWQQGDRETYVAMVESMDAGIGRVLAEVDRLGIRDDTLIVFTSDNGGDVHSRNAPMRDHKGSLWEGGVRVPCIARWPKGTLDDWTGKDRGGAWITMDWTATIRHLAGIYPEEGAQDGVSLWTHLSPRAPPLDRDLFWRRIRGPVRKKTPEGRAVRRGRWKLVELAEGERFLADLEKDVSETRNLIEEKPRIARELTEALDAWEKRHPRWYDK